MQNLIQNHKNLVKRLTLRLIKSEKNYCSSQIFKWFWWILIVYRKMCQFHVYTAISRLIFVFFLFAQTLSNFSWTLKREIDTFYDKQSRSIKYSDNFWTKSSFDKIYVCTYIHNWSLQPFSQDYWSSFSHHLSCVC